MRQDVTHEEILNLLKTSLPSLRGAYGGEVFAFRSRGEC